MKRIVIFGTGRLGAGRYFSLIEKYDVEVLAYSDNNSEKWGGCCNRIPIIPPEEIIKLDYDEVLIAIGNDLESESVKKQLHNLGICKEKISVLSTELDYMDVYMNQRFYWIKDFARWIYERNVGGSIAECGVYRGDSAKFLNRFFPNKQLYLFDTFEGFAENDVQYEKELKEESFNNSEFANTSIFGDTSVDIVLRKMTVPENVHVIKGYFPESARYINESFCFVNLDMDLCVPMLNGLRFFWDKLENGGCILCHDYFHNSLPGVKKAVEMFEKERKTNLVKTPIGDGCSLALLKE